MNEESVIVHLLQTIVILLNMYSLQGRVRWLACLNFVVDEVVTLSTVIGLSHFVLANYHVLQRIIPGLICLSTIAFISVLKYCAWIFESELVDTANKYPTCCPSRNEAPMTSCCLWVRWASWFLPPEFHRESSFWSCEVSQYGRRRHQPLRSWTGQVSPYWQVTRESVSQKRHLSIRS